MSFILYFRPVAWFVGMFLIFAVAERAQDTQPKQTTNVAFAPMVVTSSPSTVTNTASAPALGQHFQSDADRQQQRTLLLSLMGALIVVAVAYIYLRKNQPAITKSQRE